MATLTTSNTATSFGDGTKILYITSERSFLYGFGATAPTDWHKFSRDTIYSLNIGTDFGKFWYKSNPDVGAVEIVISVGI